MEHVPGGPLGANELAVLERPGVVVLSDVRRSTVRGMDDAVRPWDQTGLAKHVVREITDSVRVIGSVARPW